jgi:hypothetical protein
MKRLIYSIALMFGLPLMAADSTIGNLTPITTVPNTYRMPWENPGVQDYYITYQNLTNQILSGISNATVYGSNVVGTVGSATNAMNLAGIGPAIVTNAASKYTLIGSTTNALEVWSGSTLVTWLTTNGVWVAPNSWGSLGRIMYVASGGVVTSANDEMGSANVAASVSDETGAGALVFANGAKMGTTTFTNTIIVTNGVINYGTGWEGTTNSTAPSDAATIKSWVNYTNTTGGVFKMPLYQ